MYLLDTFLWRRVCMYLCTCWYVRYLSLQKNLCIFPFLLICQIPFLYRRVCTYLCTCWYVKQSVSGKVFVHFYTPGDMLDILLFFLKNSYIFMYTFGSYLRICRLYISLLVCWIVFLFCMLQTFSTFYQYVRYPVSCRVHTFYKLVSILYTLLFCFVEGFIPFSLTSCFVGNHFCLKVNFYVPVGILDSLSFF